MSVFVRWRRQVLGWVAGLIAGADYLANATVSFSSSQIRAGIGATPEQFLWVLTAYAAAGALAILCIERLLRSFHTRTLLLGGLALFVTGSIAAAMSQSLPQLVAARALQGLGGGPLMTCARVMLQLTVPAERRPRQLRGFMFGIFVASAPGAWLGAELMQAGDWHALFVLHAVVGVAVAALAWALLPGGAHVTRPVGHLDLWSALALVGATLLWMHALENLAYSRPDFGWWLHLLAAGALFLFFAWRLWRHPDPWLRLDTLSSRRFVAGLSFYALYYLIYGAVALALPQYLMLGEDIDLPTAGRLTSLAGAFTVLCLPIYFRLAPRLPERRYVMLAGCLLMSAILWVLAHMATGATAASQLLPLIALKGLFPVLMVIQVAGLTFREFRQLDFVHAYALKNLLRLLAIAAGSGMADIYWQDVAARGRQMLVSRYDTVAAAAMGLTPDHPAGWVALSQLIDRQAALIAASQVFVVLSVFCVLIGALVCWQRALR
jgi:MFS transporter, DHA2 family, multidrug resistance protein